MPVYIPMIDMIFSHSELFIPSCLNFWNFFYLFCGNFNKMEPNTFLQLPFYRNNEMVSANDAKQTPEMKNRDPWFGG